MDKSFHYMMMAVQSHFSRRIMEDAAKMSLTTGQPKVLDYLSLHNGSIQKDIAAGCCIDVATMTGILSRMEDKGLIERRNENGNRRSLYVYLTEKGKRTAQEVQSIFLLNEQTAFSGLDSKEKEQFLETLYKICKNLTDTEVLQ